MTRIDLAAAAVLCSFIHIGCDDGTTQPFKAKQDAATSSGGSESDGASSTGGAPGDSSAGASSTGGSGNSSGGSTGDSGSVCGPAFGHAGDCKTCLEANCCTLGNACSKIANCVSLAACTRDCDTKGGTTAQVDACRSTCANKFLTPETGQVYNPVVQCMAQSCLTQCPFHGP